MRDFARINSEFDSQWHVAPSIILLLILFSSRTDFIFGINGSKDCHHKVRTQPNVTAIRFILIILITNIVNVKAKWIFKYK